jgi:hypothetical protein
MLPNNLDRVVAGHIGAVVRIGPAVDMAIAADRAVAGSAHHTAKVIPGIDQWEAAAAVGAHSLPVQEKHIRVEATGSRQENTVAVAAAVADIHRVAKLAAAFQVGVARHQLRAVLRAAWQKGDVEDRRGRCGWF